MFGIAKKQTGVATRWTSEIADNVIALAWSPDSAFVAAAAVSGPITLFDAASGAVRHELAGHGFGTTAIAWHPSEPLLASAGQDGKIRIWGVESGLERAQMVGGAAWVEQIAWSPDGAYLASAAGKKLRFWDRTGVLLQECVDHASTIADLAWKPTPLRGKNQPALATASYGGIRLWRPTQAEPTREFVWKGSSLVLQWSPTAAYIATGDQDSTVHFWITTSGKDLQMYGYPGKVKELAWDQAGRFLATGGSPTVVIWDCSGKGPENTKPLMLEGHTDSLTALQYQPRGALLASGGADGLVMLWQPTASKRPLATMEHADSVASLVWSPDNTLLAIGGAAGAVRLLEVGM